MQEVGLGPVNGMVNIKVYMANRPPMPEYQHLDNMKALTSGEVFHIAQQTGNHWRKVFNVYAKFLYALYETTPYASQLKQQGCTSWQHLRDHTLLQQHAMSSLLFSKPNLHTSNTSDPCIHIIMGKQYAVDVGFERGVNTEIDIKNNSFAILPAKKLIICPYFDYRQLSNIKIDELVKLVNSLGFKH